MTSSKRLQTIAAITLLVGLPLSARAVSTSSYQITEEQEFWSTNQTVSTTSYQVDAAIEPITGSSSFSSYSVESGSAFRWNCGDGFVDPGETCDGASLEGATCSSQGFNSGTIGCNSTCSGYDTSGCSTVSSGGGGGGGGGGSAKAKVSDEPEAPEVNEELTDEDFYTYGDSIVLYGEMDEDTETIEINGSSEDVEFTSETAWSATVDLEEGDNEFEIIAINDDDDESDATTVTVHRRISGDVNDDDKVDDYDLSRMVRLWGSDDEDGDFNQDGIVDDYDFSIFVSRWS